MGKPTEEKLDALIGAIKTGMYSYYCKFCERHLPLTDGVYVHDDVPHPEDYIYEGGHHIQ